MDLTGARPRQRNRRAADLPDVQEVISLDAPAPVQRPERERLPPPSVLGLSPYSDKDARREMAAALARSRADQGGGASGSGLTPEARRALEPPRPRQMKRMPPARKRPENPLKSLKRPTMPKRRRGAHPEVDAWAKANPGLVKRMARGVASIQVPHLQERPEWVPYWGMHDPIDPNTERGLVVFGSSALNDPISRKFDVQAAIEEHEKVQRENREYYRRLAEATRWAKAPRFTSDQDEADYEEFARQNGERLDARRAKDPAFYKRIREFQGVNPLPGQPGYEPDLGNEDDYGEDEGDEPTAEDLAFIDDADKVPTPPDSSSGSGSRGGQRKASRKKAPRKKPSRKRR